MNEDEGFFWWSHKKNDYDYKYAPIKTHRNFCKIDGKIVEYNIWSLSKDHDCKWDDIQYLGYGEYSHTK